MMAVVAEGILRAGQAEPMFMGSMGQGILDGLPGPPGMMMGGPLQPLGPPFLGEPSMSWRLHNFLRSITPWSPSEGIISTSS